MKGNGWKIAVVVVLLAGAGYLAWRSAGDSSPARVLPTSDTYVDAASGKLFNFERTYPVEELKTHPDTGEQTLVLVYKDEDGHWYLSSHFSHVLGKLGGKNKFIDPQSRRVRSDAGN